jgi:hypothetical protein
MISDYVIGIAFIVSIMTPLLLLVAILLVNEFTPKHTSCRESPFSREAGGHHAGSTPRKLE